MGGRKRWKISESRGEPRGKMNKGIFHYKAPPPLYFLSSPQQGKEKTRNNSSKRIPDSPQMGRRMKPVRNRRAESKVDTGQKVKEDQHDTKVSPRGKRRKE
ncbi:hypothetical protein TNCT_365701 [Trichonephila clavata]|uniref:Uncharacterized protein n=1 Tax=Trichonephila clavata TaxID=2740835 RepID=A0A8X6HGH9_TRICU|nr:hypothetical protein TNCT_365701 [Trichonephila clavata]